MGIIWSFENNNNKNIKDCLESENDLPTNVASAREWIHNLTRLNLKLSEGVELRKYVEHAIRIKKLECSAGNEISPDIEAVVKFLNKNYGTDIRSMGDFYRFEYKRYKERNMFDHDHYKYSFKKMQDEMYFP